jgi:DNA/RNA endonuclease YhcR with UshA esterase domain
MKKLSITLMVMLFASLVARSYAQDAATSQPTTEPAPGEASVIDAKETDKLKELSGKSATVTGEVSGSYAAKTVLLINFKDTRNFNIVIRKEDQEAVNAAFSGDVAAALKGKTVTVTGDISLFKDKPQIQVTKPEQIKLESK